MKPSELQTQLITWSAANCGHEQHRDYIGLSGIGDCSRAIYQRYFQRADPPLCERLKHAISHELETALIARITALGLYTPGCEVIAFDGLVKGHTDGALDGDLLEIKTLGLEKWLPEPGGGPGGVPKRIYWQVQAYMLYGDYRACHLLYLARDTGAIRVLGVQPNKWTQAAIERKLETIVDAVHQGQPPACECSRCP